MIFIYTVNNDTLQESKQFRNEFGTITDMQYSPDGAYLATCDTNKTAKVRLLPDYKVGNMADHLCWAAIVF